MSLRVATTSFFILSFSSVVRAESDTVRALLTQMTRDDKLALIEGQPEPDSARNLYQAGYLPGVPRLGIPPLRLADGPPGVATRAPSTGMTCTMGVAATFSVEDAHANGVVIGRDARTLGQDVVLEPFINLDRDTSWGRGFNTFGEDPLLTAEIGAAEIRGIQSQGVMAQAKHLLAFDGSYNVVVDDQTLREVYLRPFEWAVNAGVSSLMCSYNALNGVPACGNAVLLTQILRGELGFTGFVTSDWGANHGSLFLNAGLDMEMPGPRGAGGEIVPTFFDAPRMRDGFARGWLHDAQLDTAVARILGQYERFGLLAPRSQPPPRDERANAAVVLRTAQRAATLLKNDPGVLPLSARARKSLALIGAPAAQIIATNGGGEKPGGILARQVSPLAALRARGVHAQFAVGADLTGSPVPATAWSHGGQPGLARADGHVDAQLVFTGAQALPAGTSTRWTGTLTAPESGDYWLNLQVLGTTAKLYVDGKRVHSVGTGLTERPRYGVVLPADGNAPVPTPDGLANGRTLLTLAQGPHAITIENHADGSQAPVQLRLTWVTPAQRRQDHAAAVAAAKRAHTAIVFAWDGGDLSRPMPDDQDALIRDVAQANANTLVVLYTSQPVALPWLSDVRAVLQMWHPGDEGGWATADVLLGAVSPGGHLPFTWPHTITQTLAHQPAHRERASDGVGSKGGCHAFGVDFGLDCGQTTYSEGVHVGSRFFDWTGQEPLFPFGHGLSYTSFAYSDLKLEARADGSLRVAFQVHNRGKRTADATPQVYLGAPDNIPPGVRIATRALAGFKRVTVPAGATLPVSIEVPARLLQYWSKNYGWTPVTGTRTVIVGAHARDQALQAPLTITR